MKREALNTALIFVWALCFTQLVKAATLAEFLGPYDQELIIFAAGFALFGGALRTLLSLQGDRRIVWDKLSEAGWDAAKALIAGMAAFFAIQALRAAGYAVPIEVRFGAVVAAGWSRMHAVEWAAGLVKNLVAGKFGQPPQPKDTP